jgi:hypothetical protein
MVAPRSTLLAVLLDRSGPWLPSLPMDTIFRHVVTIIALVSLLAGCAADGVPEAEERDFLDQLRDIEGMISVEELGALPGYTQYALIYEQPVDHDDPGGDTFAQHISLLHRSPDAPMVLVSTGYFNYLEAWRTEPTELLGGNQIMVEHRFFGDSRPDPLDWSRLTIEQAAADHHRVVEALAPFYTGPWVSTGASKGGMTSIYHRRFHPGDVDATIAYVSPISFAAPDERYLPFFATVGDTAGEFECRQRVREVQREALRRGAELAPLVERYARLRGYTFEILGGAAPALEQGLSELEWAFWQYLGLSHCDLVPDTAAPDTEIFDFINRTATVDFMADQLILQFQAYYYQAATQLGYPGIPTAHIADLLQYEPDLAALLPQGVPIAHDAAAMLDMAGWVRDQGTELMFIYGEYDPWSAGAFDIGENTGAHIFMAGSANHTATIADLSPEDQDRALALIESWTGVSTTGAATSQRKARPVERLEPWLRPALR